MRALREVVRHRHTQEEYDTTASVANWTIFLVGLLQHDRGATAFEPTPEQSTVGFSAAHNREPELVLIEVERASDVLDG